MCNKKNIMKKHTILVAEDNQINQFLIKTILETNGFNVVIAENGRIACDELEKDLNSYALILMDLMMPIMNGYEATEEIRGILKSKIPIIAVSADVTSNVKEKCLAIGMNNYISKPYTSENLLKTILSYL